MAKSTNYTIEPGDTLSQIAKRSGTSVARLMEMNNLSSDRIIAGKPLKIPSGIEISTAPKTQRVTTRNLEQQKSTQTTEVAGRPR